MITEFVLLEIRLFKARVIQNALVGVGQVAAKAQAVGWNMTPYNFGVPRDTSQDILARWALGAGIVISLFPRLIWSERKVKFQMKMGRIPSPGWG